MIEMNPYYAKTIVPPSKLHFTLGVFNLEDQERFDRMKYDDVILPKHRSELRHISEYFSFYFASNNPTIASTVKYFHVKSPFKDLTAFEKMFSSSRLLPMHPCTSTW